MTELETLKAELQWAIENNTDRPRTELALKWAAEWLEELMPVDTSREAKS